MTERKQGEGASQRRARLSAALRENLKRRKAQARSRAGIAERPGVSSRPKADENPGR
jgi:hypothetical protein